jgi:branched-chain amino acid aminotransferase
MTKAICWINGDLVPAHEARVSIFDHGLLYGDGVFEGIRFYRGKAFRLDAHLERLERSAAAIRLVLPCDRDALVKAVTATIAAYGLPNGYLRLLVTRGPGRLGLDPASCTRPNIIVIAAELAVVPQAVRDHGARVIIAATRRLAPDGLDPRIKSLNYLNHILARIEATNAGADEAILLNQRGHVAEGSAENVFIVHADELLTPPATDGALEGITRMAVLETAVGIGVRWREATLSPYDLYTAEECFLTGTGAELIPVREVDGRPLRYCPGPFYARLCDGFAQLVKRETV